MITYPVDVDNTLWATLQLSTGEIISRNKRWPDSDGNPIVGQDPDHVMLLQIRDTPPPYDSRMYRLISSETPDAEANTLRTTHRADKRPLDEIKTAAENVEAEQLSRHIRMEREVIETRLMVAAILTYDGGLQMPPKVQAMADEYKAKGVKIWRNRDRLKAIQADIDDGLEPDLDAGWEAPE